MLELEFANGQESRAMARLICSVDCWSVEEFKPPDTFAAVKTLWETEPVITECYNRRWIACRVIR
jgi:hypothetical protein